MFLKFVADKLFYGFFQPRRRFRKSGWFLLRRSWPFRKAGHDTPEFWRVPFLRWPASTASEKIATFFINSESCRHLNLSTRLFSFMSSVLGCDVSLNPLPQCRTLLIVKLFNKKNVFVSFAVITSPSSRTLRSSQSFTREIVVIVALRLEDDVLLLWQKASARYVMPFTNIGLHYFTRNTCC